jgi:hypothetical protein
MEAAIDVLLSPQKLDRLTVKRTAKFEHQEYFRRSSRDFSQNAFGIVAMANGYSVDSHSSAELL